ncbi:MAG: peptidoglycan DD-metalloendopeptidase family protein [Chloroflexota bacterium]
MPTPYDRCIALWYWKGDPSSETTLEGLANAIKRDMPAVTALIVKTSDGSQWQAAYDPAQSISITGADRVDAWVAALAAHGLDFHAWAVPKGLDITAEAQKIIAVCTRPGVKSMILSVQPYAGFWQGGKTQIRPLMTAIRAAIPADFHIGLSVDPRPQHYAAIFADEWLPFVQSIHPQVYWETFQQTPEIALEEAFNTWTKANRSIFPVLQASPNIESMRRARTISIRNYKAQGLSWWRFGALKVAQWPIINLGIDEVEPPPSGEPGRYGREILVRPDGPGYQDGSYDDKSSETLFKSSTDVQNMPFKYKVAGNVSSAVWARWNPQLAESGWYEISVFVPSPHSSTANARYKIAGAQNQQAEIEVTVAQCRYFDLWVSLGVYYFEASDPVAGVVILNDLTGEASKEIVFSAVRWREVLGSPPKSQYLADGFDAPIGIATDRRSSTVWPGQWIDATGYAIRYRIGTPQEAYHTGADLNLNAPYFDADAHSPVYAAASGIVTYVGRVMGWGNLIIVRHDPLIADGQVVYARYAHVESIRVALGQRVTRGEQIANVGNADGVYPYHLHFDISPTKILDSQPGHWPLLDLTNLLTNYADPRLFIAQHRPTP